MDTVEYSRVYNTLQAVRKMQASREIRIPDTEEHTLSFQGHLSAIERRAIRDALVEDKWSHVKVWNQQERPAFGMAQYVIRVTGPITGQHDPDTMAKLFTEIEERTSQSMSTRLKNAMDTYNIHSLDRFLSMEDSEWLSLQLVGTECLGEVTLLRGIINAPKTSDHGLFIPALSPKQASSHHRQQGLSTVERLVLEINYRLLTDYAEVSIFKEACVFRFSRMFLTAAEQTLLYNRFRLAGWTTVEVLGEGNRIEITLASSEFNIEPTLGKSLVEQIEELLDEPIPTRLRNILNTDCPDVPKTLEDFIVQRDRTWKKVPNVGKAALKEIMSIRDVIITKRTR